MGMGLWSGCGGWEVLASGHHGTLALVLVQAIMPAANQSRRPRLVYQSTAGRRSEALALGIYAMTCSRWDRLQGRLSSLLEEWWLGQADSS
eukprot:13381091-Alexandrium_andersonii.AAC.1